MIGKSDLAADLGIANYDLFRMILRDMEKSVKGFFVGSNKLLTPKEEQEVRQYVKNLPEVPRRGSSAKQLVTATR